MSSDFGGVAKAAEKAAGELSKAADATRAGAEENEAFETYDKNGPDDFCNELSEQTDRGKSNSFVLTYGDQMFKYRVSQSGKVLLPIAEQVVIPELRVPQGSRQLLSTTREERDRLANFAKAGQHAAKIISSLKMPQSTGPQLTQVAAGATDLVAFLPPLVQLGIWCWLKRQKKA